MVVRSKACPISVLLSKVQLTQGELIQIQLNSKVQLIQALQIQPNKLRLLLHHPFQRRTAT
jgi:hypothetical protein